MIWKSFALLVAAGLLLITLLCSCSTVGFYTQAISGQHEIIRKTRPVDEVRADPKVTAEVKQKLDLVAEMLEFAEKELLLPAQDQYRRYTDLGRPYVVWVVYATPEFSVDGKTWWYPFLGNLKYRGFFKEAMARKEADRLRKEGLDVFVGGVEAYSTLGFLRDPLLNTFLNRSEADLADLIFHELTHQRLYLSGDTDFNEAFATLVGREGTRRWLRATGRERLLASYEKDSAVEGDFAKVILESRTEMSDVYAQQYATVEAKRAAKEAGFKRLRGKLDNLNRRHGGTLKIDRWFKVPVNNARLNTMATYYDLVPGFEALLAKNGGDLKKFFDAVGDMRTMTKEERAAHLHALAKKRARS